MIKKDFLENVAKNVKIITENVRFKFDKLNDIRSIVAKMSSFRDISARLAKEVMAEYGKDFTKTNLCHFYIDFVFYNYILKYFVLIDLKTEKITHQDVEQRICVFICTMS